MILFLVEIDSILEEVEQRANERLAELLPMLIKKLETREWFRSEIYLAEVAPRLALGSVSELQDRYGAGCWHD